MAAIPMDRHDQASRSGSVGSLWSSAEVPFILDARLSGAMPPMVGGTPTSVRSRTGSEGVSQQHGIRRGTFSDLSDRWYHDNAAAGPSRHPGSMSFPSAAASDASFSPQNHRSSAAWLKREVPAGPSSPRDSLDSSNYALSRMSIGSGSHSPIRSRNMSEGGQMNRSTSSSGVLSSHGFQNRKPSALQIRPVAYAASPSKTSKPLPPAPPTTTTTQLSYGASPDTLSTALPSSLRSSPVLSSETGCTSTTELTTPMTAHSALAPDQPGSSAYNTQNMLSARRRTDLARQNPLYAQAEQFFNMDYSMSKGPFAQEWGFNAGAYDGTTSAAAGIAAIPAQTRDRASSEMSAGQMEALGRSSARRGSSGFAGRFYDDDDTREEMLRADETEEVAQPSSLFPGHLRSSIFGERRPSMVLPTVSEIPPSPRLVSEQDLHPELETSPKRALQSLPSIQAEWSPTGAKNRPPQVSGASPLISDGASSFQLASDAESIGRSTAFTRLPGHSGTSLQHQLQHQHQLYQPGNRTSFQLPSPLRTESCTIDDSSSYSPPTSPTSSSDQYTAPSQPRHRAFSVPKLQPTWRLGESQPRKTSFTIGNTSRSSLQIARRPDSRKGSQHAPFSPTEPPSLPSKRHDSFALSETSETPQSPRPWLFGKRGTASSLSGVSASRRESIVSLSHGASRSLLRTPSKHRPSTGWSSYLSEGLTLHIDQAGRRECALPIPYLSYDPFCRPESLVNPVDAAVAVAEAAPPKTPGLSKLRAAFPRGSISSGKDVASTSASSSSDDQIGVLEFGLTSPDEPLPAVVFSMRDAPPLLRHLAIGSDTKADLLTRQAALSLEEPGVHQVSGFERSGKVAWRFSYAVEEIFDSSGVAANTDERMLRPISFACSATLLDPARARKARLFKKVKKGMASSLASELVDSSTSSRRNSQSIDGNASFLLSDGALDDSVATNDRDGEEDQTTSPSQLRSSVSTLAPHQPRRGSSIISSSPLFRTLTRSSDEKTAAPKQAMAAPQRSSLLAGRAESLRRGSASQRTASIRDQGGRPSFGSVTKQDVLDSFGRVRSPMLSPQHQTPPPPMVPIGSLSLDDLPQLPHSAIPPRVRGSMESSRRPSVSGASGTYEAAYSPRNSYGYVPPAVVSGTGLRMGSSSGDVTRAESRSSRHRHPSRESLGAEANLHGTDRSETTTTTTTFAGRLVPAQAHSRESTQPIQTASSRRHESFLPTWSNDTSSASASASASMGESVERMRDDGCEEAAAAAAMAMAARQAAVGTEKHQTLSASEQIKAAYLRRESLR